MGEWSEYFEDFPEEDPANWIDGRFDPVAAKRARESNRKLASEQANLNAEISNLIKKHSKELDPRDWIDGRFDPKAAAKARREEEELKELEAECKAALAEIDAENKLTTSGGKNS
jgi:predicted 2-oxoglutarate/Fe(II)-dependent dioxygenase YbiX